MEGFPVRMNAIISIDMAVDPLRDKHSVTFVVNQEDFDAIQRATPPECDARGAELLAAIQRKKDEILARNPDVEFRMMTRRGKQSFAFEQTKGGVSGSTPWPQMESWQMHVIDGLEQRAPHLFKS